jgi:hypothetical protein
MKGVMNSEAGRQRTAILRLTTSGFGMTLWLCLLPAYQRQEWRCFYGKE